MKDLQIQLSLNRMLPDVFHTNCCAVICIEVFVRITLSYFTILTLCLFIFHSNSIPLSTEMLITSRGERQERVQSLARKISLRATFTQNRSSV